MDFLADLSKNLHPLSVDEYLMQAARYYRETKLCSLDPSRRFKAVPEIKWAFKTYGQSGAMGIRWTTEALMIGGMDDDNIAKLTGTSEDIVKAYRKIFFDVDGFLSSKDLVYACVIPQSFGNANSYNIWDFTWKTIALECGAEEFLKIRRADVNISKDQVKLLKHQQMVKSLISSGHLLSDNRLAFTQEAQGLIGVAQNYWKLSQADTQEIPKHDAADAFFNRVVPYIQVTLQNAELLTEANSNGRYREMVPVQQLLNA